MVSRSRVSQDEIWSDFTLYTGMETAIADTEDILRKIQEDLDSYSASRIRLNSEKYIVLCVNNPRTPSLDEIHEKKVPIEHKITRMFGIKTPYVLVQKNGIIKTEEALHLLSVFLPASTNLTFELPVMVPHSDASYPIVTGFMRHNGEITHYSSRVEWTDPEAVFDSYVTPSTFLGKAMEIKSFSAFGMRGISEISSKLSLLTTCMMKSPVGTLLIASESPLNTYEGYPNTTLFASKMVKVLPHTEPEYESRLQLSIHGILKATKFMSWNQVAAQLSKSSHEAVKQLFSQEHAVTNNKTVLKSAPKNSLLSGFSEILAQANNIGEVAGIWKEFLANVRRHFDKKVLLPGVDSSGPDFSYCLIYQKLQMINFCIAVGLENPAGLKTVKPSLEKSNLVLEDGSELIIPSVQFIPTFTEDKVYESFEYLNRMSDSNNERALYQSRQLKSDMSSFKSANPSATFADFISWYSPSDLNSETRELSIRMNSEGNLWRDLWCTCPAISAEKQDPLFHPVNEGEVAIDYLESLLPAELLGDMVPVTLEHAANQLFDILDPKIHTSERITKEINGLLQSFHTRIENSNDSFIIDDYTRISLEIAESLLTPSIHAHLSASMLHMFPDSYELINGLLRGEWVEATNAKENEQLQKVFFSNSTFTEQVEYFFDTSRHDLRRKVYMEISDDQCVIASSLTEPKRAKTSE